VPAYAPDMKICNEAGETDVAENLKRMLRVEHVAT
jgi:hypothetical protein